MGDLVWWCEMKGEIPYVEGTGKLILAFCIAKLSQVSIST
jgi:hypothetical protein